MPRLTALEGRDLPAGLPTVAPPVLVVSAPPQTRVIAGPIPVPIPAPYPSGSPTPVIAAPPPGQPGIDTSIPLPAGLTDPHDPLQSGDPLRILPPPGPYPPRTVAPKSAAMSGGFPVVPPVGEIDTTRGIAPPTTPPRPEFPVSPPQAPAPVPPIEDVYREMDRIRRELVEPPRVVPPQIEIREVPPTWQDYWDQLKKLIPYIPSPASTPMPVIP